MATFAPFLRKLVTAYFYDRKQEKDDFQNMRELMESIPVAKRDNIAGLLRDMAYAVDQTACKHTNVTKPDDLHEVCKVCGYKRSAYWEVDDSGNTIMGQDATKHWSAWRKVVTQKLPS